MSAISEGVEQLDENLRKWFKEKWVRFGPDGKIRGACARGDDSEGKPKCLPQSKAHSIGKEGRKYAGAKKRREDPNPERSGKAKNVSTKKKTNEDVPFNECPSCRGPIVHESMMTEKQDACYHKVKSRYKVWPSAYASGALVQCRKKGASNWGTGGKKNENSVIKGIVDEAKAKPYVKPYNDPQTGAQIGWVSSDGYHKKYWQKFAKDSAIKHAKLNPDEVQEDTSYAGGMGQGGYAGQSYRKFTPKSAGTFKEEELDEACWKGYHKEGNKKMFGKTYPNCVKNKKSNEDVTEEQLDEKCWDTHKQVGMKNKGGKQVPNCVPKESAIMKGLKR